MTPLTVAVPTRGRAQYLDVALASIAPQVTAAGAELLVVLDGPDLTSATIASRYGATILTLPSPVGLNAARNAAIDHHLSAHADEGLVIFVDDDVSASPSWLAAYAAAEVAYPERDVFGGPITPWLEGGGPAHCGREPAPITSLDLGAEDRDTEYVWGANLALRPRAISRAGRFDDRLSGRGDEEEWLDRLAAAGGGVRYVADAGLTHRRTRADADLPHLALAAYHLGRAARANDHRKGTPPGMAHEARDLIGAGWHTLARRCSYGVVFAAHSVGRIREAVAPRPASAPSGSLASAGDFVSGQSGYVAGRRRLTQARLLDALEDLRRLVERRRLSRDAAQWATPRRVQVLALERVDRENILDTALTELRRSRHEVRIARADAGDRGRFANLNRLLDTEAADLGEIDWLVIIDDDVALPERFLDAFLYLAERYGLSLAQPAHRRLSHAAWPVTRRRSGSALRETAFVEIGPVLAIHRDAFGAILPFPDTRVGWGVDAHWGALAAEHGWRVGVVDATAIAHALRPIATSYDQSAALAESRAFLAIHPHITPAQAGRTLKTHSRW